MKLSMELYSYCVKLQNTLKGDDSNKNVGNLETENSDVEAKKGASNSLVRVYIFNFFLLAFFMAFLACCDGSDHCIM